LRITISHDHPKADMIASVDRSFNKMLQGEAGLPLRLVLKEKSWHGSILSFTLTAKMGFVSTPIKGTVEVTDHELIVDADLGILNRLLPGKTVREVFGNRIKELLN
jgi:hypothetical protein